jgi:hypothetical protein
MPSGAALRQAEVKGEAAATKKRPRTTNPYKQDDPRFEMWDGSWTKTNLAQKARK